MRFATAVLAALVCLALALPAGANAKRYHYGASVGVVHPKGQPSFTKLGIWLKDRIYGNLARLAGKHRPRNVKFVCGSHTYKFTYQVEAIPEFVFMYADEGHVTPKRGAHGTLTFTNDYGHYSLKLKVA
jgi:hypothetical protein